jgi:membrane-associated phospholipid phosphatase
MVLSAARMKLPIAESNEGSRFNRVMAVTVIALVTVDMILAELVHLNALDELRVLAGLSVGSFGVWVLFAAYCYCRWRGEGLAKLGDISQLAVWSLLAIPAIYFLIPAAGRSSRPLVDSALARIDAGMHFQTAAAVRLISQLPLLRHALGISYGLLPLLILAAILVPTLFGRAVDSRRYVLAVIIAAVVTAALFALWPAAGPWTVEGFAPNRAQVMVTDGLALLKSSKPVPPDVQGGVVAFPSFHVVLAVLSVVALWNVRWARWFAFVLGMLVCISTITTGWHYLIDVVGGLAVTYPAQALANRLLKTAPATAAQGASRDDGEVRGQWPGVPVRVLQNEKQNEKKREQTTVIE